MSLKSSTCLLLLVSVAALPGCSSNGDWPNLSDKMPDPASRNRAVERANPSVTPRTQEQTPTTQAEAEELFTAVTTDIKTAQGKFAQALKAFGDSPQNDDERVHLWLEAQLALTRLSQTVSRLDAILFDKKLAITALGERSEALKNDIDAQVVAARQSLADQKPGGIS